MCDNTNNDNKRKYIVKKNSKQLWNKKQAYWRNVWHQTNDFDELTVRKNAENRRVNMAVKYEEASILLSIFDRKSIYNIIVSTKNTRVEWRMQRMWHDDI